MSDPAQTEYWSQPGAWDGPSGGGVDCWIAYHRLAMENKDQLDHNYKYIEHVHLYEAQIEVLDEAADEVVECKKIVGLDTRPESLNPFKFKVASDIIHEKIIDLIAKEMWRD